MKSKYFDLYTNLRRLTLLAAGSASLFFSGCATQSNPATSPYAGSEPSTSYAETRRSESAYVPPPENRDAAPSTKERPGLGTGWGEWRESQIGSTQFVRNSSSPQSTSLLYYNNQPGIDAMLSYSRTTDMRRATPPMKNDYSYISIWLKDSADRWLPGYVNRGNGYVVGQSGQRYEIYIKNNSFARLEVVTSVDGLDVMDGSPASYRKRGIVLNPGEATTLDGFRTSTNGVSAFRFSSVNNSYTAMKTGSTANVGVVGFAVFYEKGSKPWASESYIRKQANPFPGKRWATGPE